jgi:anti-sigma regulatory factor (Ser/Thr protein kinase)
MTTLALHILDIVQNSITAGASEIRIRIAESISNDLFEIIIEDNGSGIPVEMISKVTDPFTTSRTTRKTGLGLPLLKQQANLANGDLEIKSAKGMGTVVRSYFRHSHIDRQPLGDICGVMIILIASNPKIDFLYTHKTDSGEYTFSTSYTKEFLETDDLGDYSLLKEIGNMIGENLTQIRVSELS